MHPIHLSVAVGIECRFNPKIMLDPIGFERIHHLRLAVHEFRQHWICGTSNGTPTAHRKHQ
jgi:hypothetical protein